MVRNIRKRQLKQVSGIKTAILLFLTLAIIAGGLFFDAHNIENLSDHFGHGVTTSSESSTLPLRTNTYIKDSDMFIMAASEVRDVRAVSEVIKRLEQGSTSKRVLVLSLILCILISEGAFYTSVLPSIFPWTDVICSRRTMIQYIHSQDGAK